MRSEYHLTNGRPNPYFKKLGVKGRAQLLRWWMAIAWKRVIQPFPRRTNIKKKR